MGFNNMPSRSLILQNASHAELSSSGNVAFHKLYIANIKLEAELKGLKSVYSFFPADYALKFLNHPGVPTPACWTESMSFAP